MKHLRRPLGWEGITARERPGTVPSGWTLPAVRASLHGGEFPYGKGPRGQLLCVL